MSDLRSELAIKRDIWFESDEGRQCLKPDLLARPQKDFQFHKNRIERAFLAGAKAADSVNQEICDKIESIIST